MKGPIAEEKIAEVKQRADIVAVVSDYVTLRKAGRNYLGLCPFHSEKKPSFTVNPDKQIFYCFGCGEGGNSISFVMKVAHLSFPEAIRHLARKTGVTIAERPLTTVERERLSQREQIVRLNETVALYFTRNLASAAGRRARQYLEERGIRPEVAKEFRLGFALPGWSSLRDYLQRQQIPPELPVEAGLVVVREEAEGSGGYDRFRDRVIFPIEDLSGRIVAFGGRLIGEGDPKYLNSPETPVYTKGRHLYGLSRTREEIRSRGEVILVEGYFDLISLWNAGIKNIVASLGTALTKEQVELLRRYTTEVVILFDPDEAGRKALARSLELFLTANMRGRACVLPPGADPDSFVRTYGPERLRELIAAAPSLTDYYIGQIIGGKASLEHDRDALAKAVALGARIEDVLARNLFLKRIAASLGVDEELLKREVGRSSEGANRSRPSPSPTPPPFSDAVIIHLLHLLLLYPDRIAALAAQGCCTYLADAEARRLVELLQRTVEERGVEGFDPSAFIMNIENEAIRQGLLRRMVTDLPPEAATADRVLADIVRQLKRKWYRRRRALVQQQLLAAQKAGDGPQCERLLREKESLLKEEKTL